MKKIVSAAVILMSVCACAGAADLTSGEAVLDNFVAVTGGAAAYGKVHNLTMKGSLSMPAMGLKGTMTVYAAEPNKVSMVSELGGIGRVVEGSDGSNAWSFSAMQGPQLKKGDELADTLRAGLFHKETDWRTAFKSAELAGTEDVDGKPAYKVVLTPKTTGAPQTHYYDKESGLLVREQATRKTAFGEIPVDVSISGYRKECGINYPHSMLQTFAGQKLEMTIDTIDCNASIPTDAFDPPADVKALMTNKEPAAK